MVEQRNDSLIYRAYGEKENIMEDFKITFTIHQIGSDMCRITASTILPVFHEIADGGCICSLDVMLSEMSRIQKAVEKTGAKAVFEFFGD